MTRGLVLSAHEQKLLAEWYAKQDAEEAKALAAKPCPSKIEALRADVGVAVAQLRADAERIESLAIENDRIRGEIAELQIQLAQHATV